VVVVVVVVVVIVGDEVGEDVGEVAGAGADVENASGRVEEGEEGFAGGGVHVRGRDGCAVADGLWGVFVDGRRVGTVVRAVGLCFWRGGLVAFSWVWMCWSNGWWGKGGTAVIARRTRSLLIRPEEAKFETSSAFVRPVQRQAIAGSEWRCPLKAVFQGSEAGSWIVCERFEGIPQSCSVLEVAEVAERTGRGAGGAARNRRKAAVQSALPLIVLITAPS
jgi:hypothetical protein